MSLGKTVMMFGVGDLGGWVLEFLARREDLGTIIACSEQRLPGYSKPGVVEE